MSKADKMFEKLDYKKEYVKWEEDNAIHYISYSTNDTVIEFLLDSKYIDITNIININELKAINEKCKELGWFDE